jgi:hypothetical protein
MEERLVQLLRNTQLSDQGPRQQAEIELKHARHDPAFALSLANIASHAGIETPIRQAALSSLRQFIEVNWVDDGLGDEPVVQISEETRESLRTSMLSIVLSPEDDRKAKASARWVAEAGRAVRNKAAC